MHRFTLALAALAALACRSPAAHPSRPLVDAARADAVIPTTALASCIDTPDLLIPGAGPVVARDGAAPGTCEVHEDGRLVERSLRECPPRIVSEVEQWEPDAIVGLGGGIIAPGHPGCATEQRARAVQQLFERLGRRPWVVLTGRGPREPGHALDAAEARCADALAAQDAGARDAEGRMTEAEYMCAEVLRQYAPDAWDAVLARVVLEPRATSTVENAAFASEILERLRARRALVVSTPVEYRRGGEDNHPYRALCDFREARAHHGGYRVAAVGCPFAEDGAAWGDFE